MKKRVIETLFFSRRFLALLPLVALFSFQILIPKIKAQVSGSYELPQERELYQTSPSSSDNGSILEATNPLDLMNRLRRATAMDDATSPSDAIDEALKIFEQQTPISTNK